MWGNPFGSGGNRVETGRPNRPLATSAETISRMKSVIPKNTGEVVASAAPAGSVALDQDPAEQRTPANENPPCTSLVRCPVARRGVLADRTGAGGPGGDRADQGGGPPALPGGPDLQPADQRHRPAAYGVPRLQTGGRLERYGAQALRPLGGASGELSLRTGLDAGKTGARNGRALVFPAHRLSRSLEPVDQGRAAGRSYLPGGFG